MTRFKGLINNKKIKSPIVEAYKTLRTNIRFCDVINKIKTKSFKFNFNIR